MTDSPTITVVPDPPVGEVVKAIHAGLRAFNAQYTMPGPTTRFAVFVRDEAGVSIGGLEASVRWNWLHIDNLWLPEAVRRRGIGASVLRAAEAFAMERACTASYVDTYEFQALPFYERQGYNVFGVQEGFPPGYSRYYLQKALQPGS
jgi:GNAT superfamily N-acetyltransferase